MNITEHDLKHFRYNIKDILATFEVSNFLQKELENEPEEFKKYLNFKENDVVIAATNMMNRGVKVDLEKRKLFTNQLEHLAAEAEKKIQWIVGEQINLKSSVQIKNLFMDLLEVTPIKDRKSGKETFGSAAMLQYRNDYPEYKVLIQLILEFRSLNIFLRTFLRAGVDSDGYMRSSFNPAGTRSERWASRKNPFGNGCMPVEDTYAYTPNGWVLIKEKPSIIAQYNENGSLTFVPAIWNTYTIEEDMYKYSGRCFRGLFTKEHRIVKSKRGKLHIQSAEQVFNLKGSYQVPVSGNLLLENELKNYSDLWILSQVIYSADGYNEEGASYWRISVKKDRKKERLERLLGESIIKLHKDRENYKRYVLPWDNYSKEFPKDLLKLPLRQRILLLEELRHWDGHSRGGSYLYFTTLPNNADFVHTLAHISGYSASISIDYTNSNEYGNTSTKPLYTVNVSKKTLNCLEGDRWEKVFFKGEVACPTVSSGMWLVKYDDGIHITGNCNFQNLPEKGKIDIRYALLDYEEDSTEYDEIIDDFHLTIDDYVNKDGVFKLPNLKTMFIPEPDEYFWNIDLSAADARVVAMDSGCKFLIDVFNSGASDVYSFVASEYYGKKITKHTFPDERQIFKAVCHAGNYFGQAATIALTTGLNYDDVVRVLKFYFNLCPEIKLWQEQTREIIYSKKMLTNVWGARGWFLNTNDKMLLNKALAWLGSSPVSILINKMLVEIDKHEPEIAPRFQVHDSIAGTAKIGDWNALERIKERSKIAIPFPTPLYIPIDMKASKQSYGDCVELEKFILTI